MIVSTSRTGVQTIRVHCRSAIRIGAYPANIRTDRLNVVAPGYNVLRRQTTTDYEVVFMQPVDAR